MRSVFVWGSGEPSTSWESQRVCVEICLQLLQCMISTVSCGMLCPLTLEPALCRWRFFPVHDFIDRFIPYIHLCRLCCVQSVAMAHQGARSSKLTFLGTKEKLLSVGFTKQSQRQFKIWDPRNLSKEIKKMDIDQAAGQ